MNKLLQIHIIALVLLAQSVQAEHWYGFSVGLGHEQPFTELASFSMQTQDANNQLSPLLISDEGRWIWIDTAVTFAFRNGDPALSSAVTVHQAEEPTLRAAYLEAMKAHFPPQGQLPDTMLFVKPQYNTWIELMYNQNEQDILNYAQGIVDNGLPAGVIMIDDNWQRYYGNFDFKAEKFSDPRAMTDQLHRMGFKVMVWVCPFVSPDSPEARELEKQGFLLTDKDGQTAILRWWNGSSACYDLTNERAAAHFVAQLRRAQERYGIDGFKFDAGDNNCYASTALSSPLSPVEHSLSYAKIGLSFPLNEYRACWQMGGQPLVQRLGDKDYSWAAVQQLIPQMCIAGLLGYSYACPDMIGGGQWTSFLHVENFDQTLIVRSAQVHALMPMMQFSVAPWRILDEEHLAAVVKMAKLHESMAPYIMRCAHESAETGEPIVRSMEYQFPHRGFADCKDQFMLGEEYLVAPMLNAGSNRIVRLPKGKWRDELGRTYRGGKNYMIDVPMDRLPYFKKIN